MGRGEQLPPRPAGPRKTGRDLDSYLGYPAGSRPVYKARDLRLVLKRLA
jgi:hypothetical protein